MYAVIEHTPGYLPEDDDPPVFDTYEEAMEYLVERRQELFDDDDSYSYPPEEKDDGFTRHFELDVHEIHGDLFMYYDNRKIHDLGRIVEIMPYEATDEEIDRSFDAYR